MESGLRLVLSELAASHSSVLPSPHAVWFKWIVMLTKPFIALKF